MRILLDEDVPFALPELPGDREVKHASGEGWDGLMQISKICATQKRLENTRF
jgi:hypothetical protein